MQLGAIDGYSCAVKAQQNKLMQQSYNFQSFHQQEEQQQQQQLYLQPPPPQHMSCEITHPPPQGEERSHKIVPPNLRLEGITNFCQHPTSPIAQPQQHCHRDAVTMEEGSVNCLSRSPAASLLTAFSDYPTEKDYVELTPTPQGEIHETPDLNWVINKALERDQLQRRQKEKIEVCHLYNLLLDPWKWTSTDVTKWASWVMRKLNGNAMDDTIVLFESYPITGETLANYSEENMRFYFGEYSQRAYEYLQMFLEGMSPRGFDLQMQLLKLENAKQNYLDKLYDVMQNPVTPNAVDMQHPCSPSLTPPHSDYDAPLHPDDPLCEINSNVMVQSIKHEPVFTFPDTPLEQYQYPYPSGTMKGCPVPPNTIMQTDMGGSGGLFNGNAGLISDIHLVIDSDNDESGRSCIVKNEMPCHPAPVKRKRGRPRKPKIPKQKRDQPILYKFILKHLNDATGDSRKFLEWVNKSEGLFRFYSAKKDDFAEMWGRYKGKRDQMSYQNMARALRNYTRGVGNRKIMTSVRKKLHYKFTPNFIQ